MIHHRTARTKLYVPDESIFPMPLKYIDVMRRTYTDIDSADEKLIEDYWFDKGARELSGVWFRQDCLLHLATSCPTRLRLDRWSLDQKARDHQT